MKFFNKTLCGASIAAAVLFFSATTNLHAQVRRPTAVALQRANASVARNPYRQNFARPLSQSFPTVGNPHWYVNNPFLPTWSNPNLYGNYGNYYGGYNPFGNAGIGYTNPYAFGGYNPYTYSAYNPYAYANPFAYSAYNPYAYSAYNPYAFWTYNPYRYVGTNPYLDPLYNPYAAAGVSFGGY